MQTFVQQAEKFDLFLKENQLFNRNPENLYAPCQYILAAGGKRIRPAVCLMSAALFAKNKVQPDAFWAAAAVELFHNFTLIHDDIMDQAPLRRGNPTVHLKYGLTAGILSGDVMNIFAYKCLEHVSPVFLPLVLKLFNQTAIEVCEGQQLDMDFEKREAVGVEEYIEMIALKTAVLLACSMKMGAIVAEAKEEDAQSLYDFGKNLGIAFQLQDDLLDTFGEGAEVGKEIGGDIKANKKTILAILARLNANAEQAHRLTKLQNDASPTKITDTIALFSEIGVDALCRKEIAHYTDKAMQHLVAIKISEAQKQPFEALAAYLLKRTF